jgi:hypothetical protein
LTSLPLTYCRSAVPGSGIVTMRCPRLEIIVRNSKPKVFRKHQSFVNMDRFSALIHKQKALLFPEGRDFNGVLFERSGHPPPN